MGIEDLIHETAMLASLDHPNIIKLHGRASGHGFVSKVPNPNDGYFILLDRLTDTLDDRINRWKESKAASSINDQPSLTQVKIASSIAGVLSYLHSKDIVFCDLKPANIGFDCTGVVKLFDFGLAASIDQSSESSNNESSESNLLQDQRGTLRYMAPEIGLDLGYSFPADVYSFGMLLWEMCILEKPFNSVKSPHTFYRKVFEEGERPKLSEHWPRILNNVMSRCWSSHPDDRPTIHLVETTLHAHAREYEQDISHSAKSAIKKTLFRRVTCLKQCKLRGLFRV